MRPAIAALLTLACAEVHRGADAGLDAGDDAGLDAGVDADAGCLAPPSEAELEALRDRVRRAWCERIDPCDGYRWTDVETCMRVDALAQRVAQSWTWSEDGWMIDIAAADACLDSLECPYFRLPEHDFGFVVAGLPRACEPFRRRRCDPGPREPGESCEYGRDTCTSRHVCMSEGCGDTCQPGIAAGAECRDWNAASECERAEGELAVCIERAEGAPSQCHVVAGASAPAGEGEACGPIFGEDGTLALVPCAEDMLCIASDFSARLPRICVRPGALGEPCTRAGCVLGLACDLDTLLCEEMPVIEEIPLGAPCESDEARHVCNGQWRTECVDAVCVRSGGEGQPCDSHWLDDRFYYRERPCDDPLLCADTRTCERPLPLGASCASPLGDICESRCCLRDEQVCAPDVDCWGPDPCG